MKLTPEKLAAFCAALAETCNVGKACAAVGVSRYTAYKWRKDMPDFAEAWAEAMKAGLLALEDEAHRRAFEGISDPLTHQGQFTYLYRERLDEEGNPVCNADGIPIRDPVLDENGEHKVAAVRKYSDTLAIFLLKAHDPDKYRENSKVELTGQLAVGNMTEDEIRAELAALAASGLVFAAPADDDDISDLL
ncbi:terminase [Alcaligenaceae bacterium]|nr:terminase [Alcaligenaceae bacterium]